MGRQWLSWGSEQNTAERSDTNPASQKRRVSGLIVMKNQVAKRALSLALRTNRHSLEDPLERCIAHPGHDQEHTFPGHSQCSTHGHSLPYSLPMD